MRKIFIIFVVFFYSPSIYSQPFNPTVKTFTNGFVDKNPTFASSSRTSIALNSFEFLVFERHEGEFSNIAILNVDYNGVVGSPVFLTQGSFKNINPAVTYSNQFAWSGGPIKNALAVWQTYENGHWNLYGRSYFDTSGWGNKFIIDTTAGVDKVNPAVLENLSQANRYFILYERSGDIINKEINIISNTFVRNENLTDSDTSYCRKPILGSEQYNSNILLNYERRKSDLSYAVIKRILNGSTWSLPDTVAYAGNNSTSFVFNMNNSYYYFVSDRSGQRRIHYQDNNSSQYLAYIRNPHAENYSWNSYVYPIITDEPWYQLAGFLQKKDSLKIIYGLYNNFDSLTISDTSNHTLLKMNRGTLYPPYYARIWMAFTKDSLSFSNIKVLSFVIAVTDIKNLSSVIPEKFELFQNYPNPFNPQTKIKFSLPENNFIRLELFDQAGRVVRNLYSGYKPAGVYEYSLDASELSAGVYFYRLTAGDQIQSKKLILIK